MNNNTKVLEKKINKELKTGNVRSAIELCQMEIQSDPTNANLHFQTSDKQQLTKTLSKHGKC